MKLSSASRNVTIRIHHTLNVEIRLCHIQLREITNVHSCNLVGCMMSGCLLRCQLNLGVSYDRLREKLILVEVTVALIEERKLLPILELLMRFLSFNLGGRRILGDALHPNGLSGLLGRSL